MNALVISRSIIDQRFFEVRVFISHIKTIESQETPPTDEDYVKIMRGLFYVHLYGAFEKSINLATSAFINALTSLGIKLCDATHSFLPMALDSKFKSLENTNGATWRKRIELMQLPTTNEVANINDSIFSQQLQNAWPETIYSIMNYMGIGIAQFESNDILAMKEVVEFRNQVAHGRNSPLVLGTGKKSDLLEKRFISATNMINTYINHLENSFNSLSLIKEECKQNY